MRTLLPVVLFCLFISNASAQTTVGAQRASKNPRPHNTPYTVVSHDANSRVWERTTYEKDSDGKWIPQAHRFVELGTGMYHQDKNGKWAESDEQIEIMPDGTAQAVHGPHQVYFPPDIYSGVLELVTPDGQHLKSRPLGICYFDGTNSVFIAVLTNSIGQMVSKNQIIYSHAFAGVDADLLCTYRKSGFECDLVFKSQPPTPEVFGMSSEDSRIELLTEFFSTTDPEEIVPQASDIQVQPPGATTAQGNQKPMNVLKLKDPMLKFGQMTMAHGKAFAMNADQPSYESGIPVCKSWLKVQGRKILVEEVPVSDIIPRLQQLPSALAAEVTSSSNCILMQAAIPAQCFDGAVPDYAPFLSAEQSAPTPDTYFSYPGGIDGSLNGAIVDFYNVNDYALATGTLSFGFVNKAVNWEANQENYKPDEGLSYYASGDSCIWGNFVPVTDRREIMAFCARPRSKAVGALGGVRGVIQGEVDLTANFNFREGSDQHSAQFNWNIQRLTGFYNQLVLSLFPAQ